MTVQTQAPLEDRTDHATPESAPPAARRRPNIRRILTIGGPVLLLVLVVVGYSMWREGTQFVSTENAQVAGQPVQVGSMNAGRVVAVNVTVGSAVRRNDLIAEVALPSQTGTAQSGQPKLGFLGTGDSRVEVLAPFDGVVIAVPSPVGANVQQGQAIASLIDPSRLWVTANVEETNVGRLRIGQDVVVHVDALSEDFPGRVEAITPATAASQSLLPTNTGSGNFTKVVQLVPVRISVNLGNRPALLGASAEVKIRVAE
jgi:multidrug resistance efflux pump